MCHLLPTLYTPSTHPFYKSIKGRDSHLCLFYLSSNITSQPHHSPFSTIQHQLIVLLAVQIAFHRKPATIPSPSTCRGRPPCLPEQQLTTTANKQRQNNLPSIAGRHGSLPLHEEGAVSVKEPRWGLQASEGIVSPSGDDRGAFGDDRGAKKRALQSCDHRALYSKKAATYSPTLHCSTIGASGLNFSVRNGKRWDPAAITT